MKIISHPNDAKAFKKHLKPFKRTMNQATKPTIGTTTTEKGKKIFRPKKFKVGDKVIPIDGLQIPYKIVRVSDIDDTYQIWAIDFISDAIMHESNLKTYG